MSRIQITLALLVQMTLASFAAATPYQVLRPGDDQAACETLSSEINSLNSEVLELGKRAERQAKTAALGRGVFAGLARGASMMSYGATSSDGMAGMLASSLAAGVAQEVVNGAAAAPPTEAPQQITPQQQRLTHLTGIYRARPC